jgi:hypothetical protein
MEETSPQDSGNEMAELFGAASQDTNVAMSKLAEYIAVEELEIETAEAQLKMRRDNMDACKIQLANMMIQNNMPKFTTAGGLSPSAKIVRKYFWQAGLTEEQKFAWLNSVGLGGLIVQTVFFQTLQGALRQYEEGKHEIPGALINICDVPTIRLNNKSKFLASRLAEAVSAPAKIVRHRNGV